MSFINVADLTFAYEGSYDNIFEHVSFRLDTDWRLGFTGRNGRGKTTFLRLLMDLNRKERQYEYTGSITAPVEFEYFPYEAADPSAMGIENAEKILPGCTEPGEIWRLFKELSLMDMEPEILNRPFETLSQGEQTKLLLALLFLRENSFLLIDEPTNHLDAEARELLGQYLKKKSGFLLVSHDRHLLDLCTDHTLAINRTGIDIQKGNFSSWWENKRRQDMHETAENERLKKDISRLKAAAGQTKAWADTVEAGKIGHRREVKEATIKDVANRDYIGEKSRRMQMRRKNLERRQERAIEEKSGLLKNIEEAEELKLYPMEYRAERLLAFDRVSAAYGGKTVFENLSFELCRGDRAALSGKNGSGKSSVIRLILGEEEISHTGTIHMGSGLVISHVPQSADFLSGSLSDYARERGLDAGLLMTLLRKLDFSRTQLEKPMEDYSEGQKKKVLLAASLITKAHLYIWDEPLNYIDVFSRMQIEDLILKYRPALLFVEHDRAFAERIATKTIAL